MNIFEAWGVDKIIDYSQKHHGTEYEYSNIRELFASKKIYYLAFAAFMVGVVMTLPVIYIELEYNIFNMSQLSMYAILVYVLVLVLFVALEFYLLFLLGFYLLSYYIYHLSYIYQQHSNTTIKEKEFLAMLVRTVMELSEPDIVKYNINHKEDRDKGLLLWALVYKLKIVMTNFALKFIARKAFSRSSFRVLTPYIAAVGTGLWDSIVFYRTIRHSQYKMQVRLVILYLWENKKEMLQDEYYTKVILARYNLYGEYNNNFDYLLGKIHEETQFEYVSAEYLDEQNISHVNRDFALLLYAMKEKIYTKKEKSVISKIDYDNMLVRLSKALKSGDSEYLYAYIDRLETIMVKNL